MHNIKHDNKIQLHNARYAPRQKHSKHNLPIITKHIKHISEFLRHRVILHEILVNIYLMFIGSVVVNVDDYEERS